MIDIYQIFFILIVPKSIFREHSSFTLHEENSTQFSAVLSHQYEPTSKGVKVCLSWGPEMGLVRCFKGVEVVVLEREKNEEFPLQPPVSVTQVVASKTEQVFSALNLRKMLR